MDDFNPKSVDPPTAHTQAKIQNPKSLDRQRAAAQLKRRAEELIELPVLRAKTDDGTIVQPINPAHLSGAAKALEIAYRLEDEAAPIEPSPDAPPPQSEPVQLAFSFHLTPQPADQKTPFLKRIQQKGLSCYWEIYQNLLDSPPDWETRFWKDHPNRKREWPKKALFIAWSAAPSSARQPRTQNEFAAAIGVTTQAVWKWKAGNPEMTELINELALFPLEAAIRDVDYVTLTQAIAPDSPVPARKLFYDRYEQARMSRLPMNPQQIGQLFQTVVNNINWEQLTPEQMERIAAGEHPLAVLVSGVVTTETQAAEAG